MLSHCVRRLIVPPSPSRIVTGNNTNNKSESDQEDNDDVNDNDWSYGAEKKGKHTAFSALFSLVYCKVVFIATCDTSLLIPQDMYDTEEMPQMIKI